MTPNQIVKAYRAVNELTNTVLPYKAARGVTSLSRRLQEEFGVVAAMERAMAEKHRGRLEKGTYRFPDNETAHSFSEEYKQAMEQNDDVELPIVDLSKYIDLIRISPGAIEALDGIVIFEEDDHG